MAQSVIKPQFPPILPDGFHSVTVAEIRQLCVGKFQGSTTRRHIMQGLEGLIEALSKADVSGHVWVDGSFATVKIDPDDVDILIRVDSTAYDANPACKAAVDWASDPDRYTSHSCDAYKWIEYKSGHPLFRTSEDDRIYWTDWFGGHKPNRIAKGILVVSLPIEIA